MQGGTPDWILEQKKGISGKPGEIQKSLQSRCQPCASVGFLGVMGTAVREMLTRAGLV